MFKKLILLIIFTFSILVPVGIVNAQTIYPSRSVKVVSVSPEEGETKSYYPVWGEVVEIRSNVNGDVYAAGEKVIVQGIVNGDVIAAAREVVVDGEIKGNLRALAEKISISGEVEKNVTVTAGFLELLSGSAVNSGLIAFSKTVIISGTVGGDLKIFSQNVTIESLIGSDAEVWSDNIILEEGANLTNLTYHSKIPPDISPQATVSGKLVKSDSTISSSGVNADNFRNLVNNYSNKSSLFIGILSMIWAFIWGSLLLRFFPKALRSLTEPLNKNFLTSLLLGLGLLILVPLLSIVLMITVVGIPFAFFLIIAFIFFSYFAKILFSFWLGQKLIKEERKAYLSLGIGLLIYYILRQIGFFGGIFVFVVYLAGMGSQFKGLLKHYSELHRKKLI